MRQKKRKIGIERYREEIKAFRRRELRTIPYSNNGKTEVDSEYATTDNEEHIQEQSNQDKSYFDSESLATKVVAFDKENRLWMVHIQSCGII